MLRFFPMQCLSDGFIASAACAILFGIVFLGLPQPALGQSNTEASLLSSKEFILSEEAAAAGIDGKLTIQLTVDKTGAVKDPKILGGFIWPCKSTPKEQLAAVENAVMANLLEAKFAPATKDGKPRQTDILLTFLIGKMYRDAKKQAEADEAARSGAPLPKIIDSGVINGRALSLPKPEYPGAAREQRASGTVSVNVVIGEDGDIIAAGSTTGHPTLRDSARKAACRSRFSPTSLKGQPVRVMGVITYNFVAPR